MSVDSTAITATDMFCGAGGSSLGAHSEGIEVYLAINHWTLAVETHNTNFPDTLHDCADVSATDPRRYPSTTILMASPECTHHTYASGRRKPSGQMDLFSQQKIDPTAERSRATMWDVPRFAEHHGYEIVIVENVVEARKWAPFDAWLHAMSSLGYDHKVVYLNSMFFPPTPQSRDRMYVVFWKHGNNAPDLDYRPSAYCPTCEKNVEAVQSWNNPTKAWGKWGRYRFQYVYRCPACAEEVTPYYYCAANAVDWSDLGERIGDRSRPLKPKTLKRIEMGLEKYGNQSLLIQLAYGHAKGDRSSRMVDPLPTQSTRQSVGLLATPAPFMVGHYSPGWARSLDEPTGSITATDHHSLVSPPFVVQMRNNQTAHGIDEAMSTTTSTGSHHALLSPAPFVASYYGSGGQLGDVSQALATVTAVDKHALVSPTEPLSVEDCYFRMFQPHEIQRGMAFPSEYVVLGTKRDQTKQLGNAVTPPAMRWLTRQAVRSLA